MINLTAVKKFCKDYTRIENYEEAVNDTTRTWICHHILGEILSREQLQDHDFYYDVPPCMLKFVTRAEHMSLHNKGRTGKKNPMYGRTGNRSPNYGKKFSDETRKKMSDAHKGRKFTVITRMKMSEAQNRRYAMQHVEKFSD